MTDLDKSSGYWRLARVLLGRVAGFDRCPPETLDFLVDSARIERVAAGGVVSRRGKPFEQLTLILDGLLVAGVETSQGRRHLASYLKVGEVTGLAPCIDEKPMPHDTYAHTDVVLLHIPAEILRRRRSTDPSIAIAFEIQLATRARLFYDMTADLVLTTPRARLWRLLQELANDYGEDTAEGRLIAARITQSDLADLIGTSRQWTNKELRNLERAGILMLQRSRITLRQPQAMTELAATAALPSLHPSATTPP